MNKVAKTYLTILLYVLAGVLCACSSSSSPDPQTEQDAKEIKAKTKSSLDLPELELFSSAKRQYQASLYSVARDSFSAIKDNYPTGPFAEFAELKIADTQFENSDFQDAAKSYEEFVANRPASSALPYALLRAARSHELTNRGIGRDPTPLEKALELYTSLLQRFPNSVYCSAARYYKKGVEELLAAHEQQVIAFYNDKDKELASKKRDQEFQKRYGTSSSEYQPGNYDKRAPLAVGPVNDANVKEAKQALGKLAPIEIAATNSDSSTNNNKDVLPEGKSQISSVNCDPQEKLVILAIAPKPEAPFTNLNAIKKGDSIELRIPEITTLGEETKTYSCFSEGDLTISSNGLITLRVESTSVSSLFVDNPARIIITIK